MYTIVVLILYVVGGPIQHSRCAWYDLASVFDCNWQVVGIAGYSSIILG